MRISFGLTAILSNWTKLVESSAFNFFTWVQFPSSPSEICINLKTIKKPRINNQIIASPLRVIDENGNNIGVIELGQALEMAKEKGLDLIEISPTANPPIVKIMDYGKYQYKEKKKLQESSKKAREVETKNIRLKIGTSQHDLEFKAKKISEFLKEGNRVKVDLVLRGAAKYLDKNFLKGRIERILPLITENCKIVEGPKQGPAGIGIIIEKTK